jgi:hypothetical protein
VTSENVSGVRYNKGCQLHWVATGGIVLSPDAYLVSVPDAGPPYDCDIHGTTCQAPASPAGVGAAGTGPAVAGPTASRRPVLQTLASCAGTVWPRQFAQAIVETLAGTRPVRQIIPWTTERAQAHIRTLCPLFRTDSGPRMQRVLSSYPSSDVVEVTVIAGFGPRTRALALRFEHVAARQPVPGLLGRPARWLCTDIETG